MRIVKVLIFNMVLIVCLAQQSVAEVPAMPESEAFDGVFPVAGGTTSLTVAGEGIWYRNTYQPGEQPNLTGVTSEGGVLPDGAYRFEFRSVEQTSDATSGEAKHIQSGHGTKIPVNENIITGTFSVSGGQANFQ